MISYTVNKFGKWLSVMLSILLLGIFGLTQVSAGPALGTPGVNEAVLTTSKTISDEPLLGGDVAFTINVMNTAPLEDGLEDDKAYNITVTDTLPAGLNYSGGNPAPTTITVNPDGTTTLEWVNISDLEANEDMSISVNASIDPSLVVGDGFTNTVIAEGNTLPDNSGADITSNVGSVSGAVQAIDIEKQVNQSTGVSQATGASGWEAEAPGEGAGEEWPFSYTISVRNNNVGSTNNVVVTDILPPGVAYLGTTSGQGEPAITLLPDGSLQLVWNLDTLTTAEYATPEQITFNVAIPYRERIGTNPGDCISVNATDPGCFNGDVVQHHEVYTNEYDAVGQYNGAETRDGSTHTPTDDLPEPVSAAYITVQKSVDNQDVEYGDRVTFTLNYYVSEYYNFENVTLTDVLPDGLQFVATTASPAGAVETVSDDTPSTGQTTITWDIPTGETQAGAAGTITFTADVLTDYENTTQPVLAFDRLTNNVNVEGDYTDDVDPTRTGTVGDNDSAYVQLDGPSIDKQVWDPTLGAWIEEDISLAVGDEVRFRLFYTAPAGVDAGENYLIDFLPAGMSFVSQDSCTTSGATQLDPCVPSFGTVGALNTVRWDYGNVDLNFTAEYEITAVVDNIPSVVDGVIVSNFLKASGVNTFGETYSLRDLVTGIKYVEPVVELTKSVSPSSNVQPGQQLTYTIVVTNTQTDPDGIAHNFSVTDTLPANLQFNGSCTPATSTCTPTAGATAGTGGTVVWTFTDDDLDAGESVTLTYQAEVIEGTPARSDLVNIASTEYNSQEDDAGRQTDITSNTSDPNTDDAVVRTALPTVSKVGTPAVITVGEDITYTIQVTVPPYASMPSAVVRDNLLTNGLTYNNDAVLTNISGTPFTGAVLPVAPTINEGAPNPGERIEWAVGDLDNSTSATPYVFEIEFSVVFDGIADDGTSWEMWQPTANDFVRNQAQIRWQDISGTTRSVTSNNVDTQVDQPLLDVDKTVTPSAGVQGGDTVTYTIVIENVGYSTAHQVNIDDDVPAGLIISQASLDADGNGGVADANAINPSGANAGTITWSEITSIAVGDSVTFSYTAEISPDNATGATLTNIADANWSSMPGADPEERIYNDSSEEGNTWTDDTDPASVTIIVPNMEKTIIATSADHTSDASTPDVTIGEIITYQIVITVPANTATPMEFRDILDAGLEFTEDYTITYNGFSPTDPATVTPTFVDDHNMNIDFGTVSHQGAANATIVITYDVLVENVTGNAGDPQTSLDNAARLTYNTTGTIDDATTVEVVEPVMEIEKLMSPSIGFAGDEITITLNVTNTGNAKAFDVIVSDPIDETFFENVSAGLVAPGFSYGAVSAGGFTTVTFTGGDLDIDESVQFVFTVDLVEDFVPQEITNTAYVTQATTLPGDNPFERDEPDVEDDAVLNGALGSIGDTVWLDTDGDGIQNNGESGIPNVDVTLTYPGGIEVTVTTDPAGNYLFEDLPEGEYTVTIDTSTLPADLTQTGDPDTAFDHMHTYDLEASEDYLDADFGYQLAAPAIQLDKTVYAGWTAGAGCPGGELVSDDLNAQITFCFTVTNTGNTWLDDVAVTDNDLGIVRASMIQLSGTEPLAPGETLVFYYQTRLTESMVNTADTSGNPTDGLGADLDGQPDPTDDDTAEVVALGAIGDTIWTDTNADGIQNGAETGIGGVTVTLTYPDSSTVSVVTAADGTYLFEDLPLGSYTVTVDYSTVPDGLVISGDPDGLLDHEYDYALGDGETFLGADFGYTPASTAINIEKTVYDSHDSGVSCNSGVELETGPVGTDATYCFLVTNNGNTHLAGVTVDDTTLSIDESAMTLISGTLPLAPGASMLYYYESSMTADLVNTAETTGNPVDPTGADVPGLTDPTDSNTAEVQLVGSIGDTIWADTDGDGIQNNGETGISGVVVTLTHPDGSTTLAVTNADGEYLFSDLPPGDYTVAVTPGTLPNDLIQSGDPDATVDHSHDYTLGSGEDYEDADFGYTPAGAAITLAKTVYEGHDAGATCPTAGELVRDVLTTAVTYCFEVTNTGNTFLADIEITDTTLGNVTRSDMILISGTEPLAPGASMVFYYETTLVGTLTNTAETEGNPVDGQGNDIVGEDNPTAEDTADVLAVGSIGDTIWADTDGDGVQNNGEIGIPNVDVILTYPDGSQITLTTDTDGEYLFTDLPAGDYTVTVDHTTLPPSLIQSGDPDAISDHTHDYSLGDGEDYLDADFGYTAADPSIDTQKTVYAGHDLGASCAGDELTINALGSNVTYCFEVINTGNTYLDSLSLTDANLGINETNMTLLSGSFPLAPAASALYYYETTLDGTLINTINASGNPTDSAGNDIAGEDDPTADDTAEVQPWGSIGDYVWYDENGDGIQDPSENGLEGVLVKLTYPDGTEVIATTGPDGEYLFDELPQGNYTVEVVPNSLPINIFQTGDPDAVIDHSHDVALAPGQDYLDADFGYDDAVPGIDLQKTVYRGHDAGVGCATAVEEVRDILGTLITWCFVVTNTTNTHLDSISIGDTPLGITEADMTLLSGSQPLAPTESMVFYYETTLTETLDNLAQTTANPTDSFGNDIPGAEDPTAQDEANVVALGSIGDYVWEDTNADGIQDVSETGIGGVTVNLLDASGTVIETATTNPDGSYLFDELVEGEYTVQVDYATVPGGLFQSYDPDSIRDHEHTYLLGDGEDFLGDDFGYTPATPGISLAKTVYEGHTAGTDCAAGLELVDGPLGTTITYCFEVTNTGNTYLDAIVLNDATLGITRAEMTVLSGTEPLAPAASMVFYYETTLTGSLVNTADTSANPTDEYGEDIHGVDDPTAQDTAEVLALGTIGDTIYLDADGNGTQDAGENGIPAVDVNLYDETGTLIATVTTDANGNYLFPDLPQGDYTVAVDVNTLPTEIFQTADPDGVLDDQQAYSLGDGEIYEGADFGYMPADPNIALEKTINGGHENGANCPGYELIISAAGKPITYCFQVTNTGNTWLDGINITDSDIGMTHGDLTLLSGTLPLAPGESAMYYVHTQVESSLLNTANVSGNPVDSTGDDIPGSQDPTDTNTAEHLLPGKIGDTVWLDTNGDGNYEPGESGIAGVTVTLYDSLGNVVATDVTDADGKYLFETLPADNYTVVVDDSTLPPSTPLIQTGDYDGTLDHETQYGLGPDEEFLRADFGYVPASPAINIDKTVYAEHNAGASCPTATAETEAGIGSNITYCFVVTNTGNTWLNNVVVNDTTLGLTRADLTLLVGTEPLAPAESMTFYYETTLNNSLVNEVNTSADPEYPTGDPIPELEDPTNDDTAEVTALGSIGDRIWLDANADGVQDAGEVGIEGVTVMLFDGTGTMIATAVTDSNGNYLFPDLPVDSYNVLINPGSVPDALIPTFDPDGTLDFGSPYQLGDGEDYRDHDFGFQSALTEIAVQKTVYLGHDSGAQCPGGELSTGVSGTTVTFCFEVANLGNTILDNVTLNDPLLNITDADMTLISGSLPLQPNTAVMYYYETEIGADVTNIVTATGDPVNESGEPIVNATSPTSQDIAKVGVLGSIGDTIWFDTDGNGEQDAGEAGLANITVTLTLPDGSTLTTETDANGNYLFENLPSGDYTVTVDTGNLPAGSGPSYDLDGDLDNATTISLVNGADRLDADFGYRSVGSIGDTIWLDTDGDGTQNNNEAGLADVTVTLTLPDGSTRTTVTDADGKYLFADLPAGDYEVEVDTSTVPAGLTQSGDPDSTLDSKHTVNLGLNEDYLDADFGYNIAVDPTPTATPEPTQVGTTPTPVPTQAGFTPTPTPVPGQGVVTSTPTATPITNALGETNSAQPTATLTPTAVPPTFTPTAVPQQPAQSTAVPTPSIQTDTLAGTLQVNRDLSISKTSNSSIAQIGDSVIYNITINNPTQFTTNNVIVTDVVDPRIDILNVNSTAGTTTNNGNIVTVQIPMVDANQTITISIIGRVNAQAVAGNAIDNTASLTGEDIDARSSNTATVQLVPNQIPTTGDLSQAPTPWMGIIAAISLCAVAGYLMRFRKEGLLS